MYLNNTWRLHRHSAISHVRYVWLHSLRTGSRLTPGRGFPVDAPRSAKDNSFCACTLKQPRQILHSLYVCEKGFLLCSSYLICSDKRPDLSFHVIPTGHPKRGQTWKKFADKPTKKRGNGEARFSSKDPVHRLMRRAGRLNNQNLISVAINRIHTTSIWVHTLGRHNSLAQNLVVNHQKKVMCTLNRQRKQFFLVVTRPKINDFRGSAALLARTEWC